MRTVSSKRNLSEALFWPQNFNQKKKQFSYKYCDICAHCSLFINHGHYTLWYEDMIYYIETIQFFIIL